MSAERSTDSIVDLLYSELSEEEAAEMRAELAESAELRAEYDELDMMLGRVRTAMPVVEVSPAIHDAIMEAARAGAQSNIDDRIVRRAPESRSFWSRLGSGQGSQLALVAAVLVAGLFVVRFVERSNSPLHAPAADISSMQEAAPAARAALPVTAEAEKEEAADEAAIAPPAEVPEGESVADQWSADDLAANKADDKDQQQAAAQEPDPDIAKSLRNELAATERQRTVRRSSAKADADEKKPAAPAPVAKPTPTREPAPQQKAAKKKEAKANFDDVLTMDKFDDSSSSTSGSYGSGVTTKSAPSSSKSTSAGSLGLDVAPEPEPTAAAEEAPQYHPSAGSIDTVNQYFRSGDYNGAIRAADEFLTSNTRASSTEKATAMHVKAQSLMNLGKYSEADRILQQIQTNYPGYQSAGIDEQRQEIRQRNVKRKAKPASPKKAAEDSRDYEFDALE